MKQYLIPKTSVFAEYEIKRSRFLVEIRKICSLEEMRSFYLYKKAEHPKANHNCWAVITGAPDDSNGYGFSDDGEPSGCAGKPILNVLSHSNIGQIGLVVTRYFGGIKLGTGGMVKAYSEAAKLGVAAAILEEYAMLISVTLTFKYDQEPSVRYFLKSYEINETEFIYTDVVELKISMKETLLKAFKSELIERFGIFVTLSI